ncbi:SDR family oxidoreductase [Georgenia yuyongxinii]
MPTYAVTGATGHLGRLVLDQLLERGVAPADVLVLARTPEKAADLAARGVQVREADYDRPETLGPALAGVDKLLLISGSEVGGRVQQHTNVVEAARNAGVSRILYTSMLRASTSTLVLAPEHKGTEEVIAASGLSYTFLRNPWYVENYTDQVATYLAQGTILHATGEGRIALGTRPELAEAAVVALLEDVEGDVVYELGGPSYSIADLAAAITEVAGRSVEAEAVSAEELTAALTAAGLDEGLVGFLVTVDRNIADGDLDNDTDDLARLLGRPVGSLADAVRAARVEAPQTV